MMPGLLDNGRRQLLFWVFVLVCGEGLAAGAGAVATRGLFNALHSEAMLATDLMVLLALSGLVIAACRVASRTRGEKMGQAYALEIRQALFNQGTFMSVSDVSARRTGYMSLRFVGDLTAFKNWLGLGLPRLLAAMVLIPLTLFVLGWMHTPFLVVVAPLYFTALLTIGLGGMKLPRLQRRVRSRRAAIAADMAERMPIAPALGQLGRRSNESSRITRRSRRLITAALDRITQAEWLKSVPDMISGMAALGVIWIGSRDGIDTGTIAGGLAALGIALKPMRDLATVWDYWSSFQAAHRKCVAALERTRRRSSAGGKTLRPQPLKIKFRQLNLPPVNGLSGSIKAGARVLLTGDNGSGKSRLLRALNGLDKPDSGAITLGGKPIEALSQGTVRRCVLRISDDVPILRGSLRKALTMGLDRRPDDDELLMAAAAAGLAPTLETLGGLDSKIAEGGRNLSEGERVKIALTRAMLADPGIILVDACAGQLDTQGEQALRNLLATSRATIMVVKGAGITSLTFDQILDLNSTQLLQQSDAEAANHELPSMSYG
ncbi:ABC transporter ATP-binding protein [Marinobacter sp.]|uniref:ABC transporter ATP-binding protein n=1 Tax=Marinobacter sp. TaxID=50741 RepID=UPI002B48C429|nr:ABC transporter ATP-binding protein [Marinobacter sp.]HKK54818.1 ABC transporter ATP-binding protein [Marinobacter sp.]